MTELSQARQAETEARKKADNAVVIAMTVLFIVLLHAMWWAGEWLSALLAIVVDVTLVFMAAHRAMVRWFLKRGRSND